MSAGWLADDAYEAFKKRRDELYQPNNLNEDTTRLRIIDTLLFEVLGWDKNKVETEKYTRAVGFLDYVFGMPPRYDLVLEAKRNEIAFVLPSRQYPSEPVPFALIAKESKAAADALRQAQGYANQFGARYSAISNGHQWLISLTFVPNETVDERLVYVFESLDAIGDRFRTFYECFSPQAIATNLPSQRLLEQRRAPAPHKLSASISGYPAVADRNRLANALRGVLQLLWDEINLDTDSEVFLRHCYIVPESSEDMLRVAHELFEQRHSADTIAASIAPADAKKMLLYQERADKERPVVLLGRIGHGKSTFMRYLRHIEAKTILENKYVQIDLDFNERPATADEVPAFILDQVEQQLTGTYHIEIWSDSIVRQALKQELKEFRSSPRGKLLGTPGREKELENAEVEFIETYTKDRAKYFAKLMRLIRRGHGKSIAIFFDNLDRRPDNLQEQAFLRASAIATDWSALVFVCLRPGTVQRSQARGVLDTLVPRVITISPPSVTKVLRKRFQYARKFAKQELPDEVYARASYSNDIRTAMPLAAEFFGVCDESIRDNSVLADQYEAAANGNIRLVLKYMRDTLTSNHLDTQKILEKIETEGTYVLAEHETLRALLFGEYLHYDPNVSLFANIFEIRRADPSEHFCRFFLLDFCNRHAHSVDKYGFIPLKTIDSYLSSLGYTSTQVVEATQVLFAKKCIEGRDYDKEAPELRDEVRITGLGTYQITRLVRQFSYLDAVVVDTPILADKFRIRIKDVHDIFQRLERARVFLQYLDLCVQSVQSPQSHQIWLQVSHAIANNMADIEAAAKESRSRNRRKN